MDFKHSKLEVCEEDLPTLSLMVALLDSAHRKGRHDRTGTSWHEIPLHYL